MLNQICIGVPESAVKQQAYSDCVAMRPHPANYDTLHMTCELPHLPSHLPDTLRTSRATHSIVADLASCDAVPNAH